MIEPFRQIPVAALVAALVTSVATFYVILGGTGVSTKRKGKGPRGLANYGRSCYMNAVLQAFASSSSVQEWLARRSASSPLKAGLLKCMRLLNRQEDSITEEVTPTDLFQALSTQGFVITGEEQDAHELVQGLLDVIESDKNESEVSVDPLSMQCGFEESSGVLNRLGQSLGLPMGPLLEDSSPFMGRMTCRVDNQKENSPTKSLMFNNITLYLPSPGSHFGSLQPITLESLLKTFVALERVENSITKQQAFARLPKVLVLHIQRTAFHCQMAYKRQDKVTFPFFLHMDEFAYAQQLCQKQPKMKELTEKGTPKPSRLMDSSRNVYQLCAVICHFGEIESGHYITYRKCILSGGKVRWFSANDADIIQVSLDKVMEANPYILLYERLHDGYKSGNSQAASTAASTTASPLTPNAPSTATAASDDFAVAAPAFDLRASAQK